ncbi:MAG: hypothetical protein ACNA8W_17590, partial [Bradymonadaceae bacterium]
IRNGRGYGLAVEGGGDLTDFENNTFADNQEGPVLIGPQRLGRLDAASDYAAGELDNRKFVRVLGSTIDEGTPQIWNAVNVPYVFSGKTDIQSGVEILAGAELQFQDAASIEVNGSGYFQVHGEAGNRVTFTSERVPASRQAGDWKGILYRSNHTQNEISHADIHYGGHSTRHSSATFENANRANVMVTSVGGLHLDNVELGYVPATRHGLACEADSNVSFDAVTAVGIADGFLMTAECIVD